MTNGWLRVPLGDLLSRVKEEVELKDDVFYKQVTIRLWNKGVVLRGEQFGSEIKTKRQFRVRAGELALSRIDVRNGAIGLVPPELDGAIVSNDFWTYTIDQSRLDPKFITLCVTTPTFLDDSNRTSSGTTKRIRADEGALLRIQIPLPPLPEQQRLVARIESLARRIEEARGLRRAAVEEGEALVNASARELLSEIKAPVSQLRDWLDEDRNGIQTGPFGAQLGSGDFVNSGVPVITIGNVQHSGLVTDGLRYVAKEKARKLERFVVKQGDILFARMGTVGRSCVAPGMAEGWLYNYHIIRVALDTAHIEPRYIHWTIRASADIEKYLGEKIRGATRQGVNSEIVGSLPCRVPDLLEQHRLVAYLDGLQAKVDDLRQLQAATQTELDALIPSVLAKAFAGEL